MGSRIEKYGHNFTDKSCHSANFAYYASITQLHEYYDIKVTNTGGPFWQERGLNGTLLGLDQESCLHSNLSKTSER